MKKTFKEFRESATSTGTELTEASISKYDVRYFSYPKVEFKSTTYAADAHDLILKKMKWKLGDNKLSQSGSTIRFNDYKIKEKEAVAAFKKSTGVDLNKL